MSNDFNINDDIVDDKEKHAKLDNHESKGQTQPSISVKMGWLEITKLSTLICLADVLDDMDEYYLYWLIPISRYGCDCTNWAYGIILLVKGLYLSFFLFF